MVVLGYAGVCRRARGHVRVDQAPFPPPGQSGIEYRSIPLFDCFGCCSVGAFDCLGKASRSSVNTGCPCLRLRRCSSREPAQDLLLLLRHRDVSTGLLRRDRAHLHGLRHLAQLRHIHLPGHPLAPITFDLSLSSDHVHFEFEPAGRTHSPHPTHLHTAHRTLERRPYAACDGPACSFVAAWLLGPTA